MAIWQFKIELIPDKWVSENSNGIEILFTEESYDSEPAWNGILSSSIKLKIIDKFYSRYTGWHKDHICWGNEEGTDIQFWQNGNYVESLSVRLDARGNLNSDIISIVSIAKELCCCLFLPEKKVIIEPIEHEVRNGVIGSRSAAFVRDPVAFLKKIT